MSYIYSIFLLFCLPNNLLTLSDEDEKDDNLLTFPEDSAENNDKEILLCRKCGADIANSHYIFPKLSPNAKSFKKQSMFGQKNVTIQELINPFGYKFEVVTTEKARCENLGQPQGGDSWFPGYKWRICACPFCGNQLGWTFENENISKDNKEKSELKTFYALILTSILGENCETLLTYVNYILVSAIIIMAISLVAVTAMILC